MTTDNAVGLNINLIQHMLLLLVRRGYLYFGAK